MLRTRQAAQKGPDARLCEASRRRAGALIPRSRPTAAREAYSLYVERAAEGANDADGPFSAACYAFAAQASISSKNSGRTSSGTTRSIEAGLASPRKRARTFA
jgi:hypothetical protein